MRSDGKHELYEQLMANTFLVGLSAIATLLVFLLLQGKYAFVR